MQGSSSSTSLYTYYLQVIYCSDDMNVTQVKYIHTTRSKDIFHQSPPNEPIPSSHIYPFYLWTVYFRIRNSESTRVTIQHDEMRWDEIDIIYRLPRQDLILILILNRTAAAAGCLKHAVETENKWINELMTRESPACPVPSHCLCQCQCQCQCRSIMSVPLIHIHIHLYIPARSNTHQSNRISAGRPLFYKLSLYSDRIGSIFYWWNQQLGSVGI